MSIYVGIYIYIFHVLREKEGVARTIKRERESSTLVAATEPETGRAVLYSKISFFFLFELGS